MTDTELDVLVARKVMGLPLDVVDAVRDDRPHMMNGLWRKAFSPSISIEDAWEVVDEMRRKGFAFFIESDWLSD